MTGTPALPSAVALEDVLRRGREALAAGRLDGALRTFDDALRMKPTYAPAWRAKGRALRSAGDAEAALACYAEALRNEPDDEGSWFGLALTLHTLGRRDEEVQAYDELLRRNPGHVAAWMNRGVVLHESGAYEEALRAYDRILAARPEFAPAWNNRGAALLRLGRPEEALAAIDEALALDPGFEDAGANRRAVLAALRREVPLPHPYDVPPSAALPATLEPRIRANLGLPAVEAWRRTRMEDAEDYVALGTALLDEGSPALALGAFRKAGSGPTEGLGALLALQVAGDPRAPEEARRLVTAFPANPRVVLASARVLEGAGDPAAAASALEGLLAVRPDLAWAWSWRGLLALQAGRPEDARAAFERATSLDSKDADGWAGLAASLHLMGRTKEALAACDRALKVERDHAAAWNNRGVILAASKRSSAESALRKAAKSGPDPVPARNRARLAEARGAWTSALKLYETVLKNDPEDAAAASGRDRVRAAIREKDRASRARLLTRLERIPGIGPATAAKLVDAGFDTAAKLRRATVAALRSAGLTPAQARAVRDALSPRTGRTGG